MRLKTFCVFFLLCHSLFVPVPHLQSEEFNGLLRIKGSLAYPLGSYELPETETELARMAKAGINLVRCANRQDLDRAHAVGMQGWIPLPLHAGATEALRKTITELRDHPALALWEGPDEVVWNFTMYSGLKETAGFSREDWYAQKPAALEHARREGAKVIVNMRQAIALIRELDTHRHPVWINEAAESDVFYCRQYMDVIDVTGCDYYPVKHDKRNLATIGRVTDRWRAAGRDKPVWMVLQAFSWHKGDPRRYTHVAYPSYEDSRLMAYASILHGARGVLYWGSQTIDQPEFRQSIYALAAELSSLQPFLVVPAASAPTVKLIEADLDNKDLPQRPGVRASLRRSGTDWLLILINEDDVRHMGVEVTGLDSLNGRELHRLYSDEKIKIERIERGELLTRMRPYETQVFCTSPRFEAGPDSARKFGQNP